MAHLCIKTIGPIVLAKMEGESGGEIVRALVGAAMKDSTVASVLVLAVTSLSTILGFDLRDKDFHLDDKGLKELRAALGLTDSSDAKKDVDLSESLEALSKLIFYSKAKNGY